MPSHRDNRGTARGERDRRGTVLLFAAAVVLALAGAMTVIIGVNAQQRPPAPSAAAARGSDSSAMTTPATPVRSTPAAPPQPASLTLPAAVPTHIDIPAIGVNSGLMQLGTNPDGTVQVPPLDEQDSKAGWYTGSPAPGQLGPSVILGHIDSKKYGPAVFFKLGALMPADQVSITRADGTVAVFTIDKVAEYPKSHFPTIAVYGNTDDAALRLITCGGTFDFSAHSYEDNIVVYAHLASTHPA